MKTVFLCRDGLAARFIAHRLSDEGRLDAVIAESGSPARRRKLKRSWDRTRWWATPGLAVDLTALTVYGRAWSGFLRQRLADHPASSGWPDVPLQHFEDANDPPCVDALVRLAPDVIVVLGTSILRTPVLQAAPTLLNIHGGIVPKYRNVHSEVWAVLNDDVENAGTSILHLDEGIDSGAVALQRRVVGATSFFDLRWKNLELSAELIVEALRKYDDGSLPAEAQPDGSGGFYPTPGARDLLRLRAKKKL